MTIEKTNKILSYSLLVVMLVAIGAFKIKGYILSAILCVSWIIIAILLGIWSTYNIIKWKKDIIPQKRWVPSAFCLFFSIETAAFWIYIFIWGIKLHEILGIS